MKEKIVTYGQFDAKNEKGYVALKAIIEYEDILSVSGLGSPVKTGEREYGCYDVLEGPGNQRGLFFPTLQRLIENSRQCYGKYSGFHIYEVPVVLSTK